MKVFLYIHTGIVEMFHLEKIHSFLYWLLVSYNTVSHNTGLGRNVSSVLQEGYLHLNLNANEHIYVLSVRNANCRSLVLTVLGCRLQELHLLISQCKMIRMSLTPISLDIPQIFLHSNSSEDASRNPNHTRVWYLQSTITIFLKSTVFWFVYSTPVRKSFVGHLSGGYFYDQAYQNYTQGVRSTRLIKTYNYVT